MKLCLAAAAILIAASTAGAVERFDIAITVDDLTAHGPLPQGTSWPAIAQSYVDTLRQHGVPEAYGFVNAKRIAEAPASEPVLDIWRNAGYPLGNHTFSHMNIDQAPTLQAWLDDVKAGEPAIAKRMADADWRYLRYPFLAAGSTPERHDGALAWLKQNGYKIAEVSVSFDDWAYTETYGRCLAKGDSAGIEAMKAQYFKGVDASIARMKAVSQRVYGRVIPQVLLTHMGAWSALTLPTVMAKLDAAGARYVSLAQAQADPAYADAGPVGKGVVMDRKALQSHINIWDLKGAAPVNNLEAMCR